MSTRERFVELDLGWHGPSAFGAERLRRRLEHIRHDIIELLALAEPMRNRHIVLRPHPEEDVDAASLPHPEFIAGESLRHLFLCESPAAPEELVIWLPRALRAPATIERLMVDGLLRAGLNIPQHVPTRFLIDGVLGVLAARAYKKSKLNLPLMEFLAARTPEGLSRPLNLIFTDKDERQRSVAVCTSVVKYILDTYGPGCLAIFARNLKPAAPDEASRAAFHKPFSALDAEWRGWANRALGRPLSVSGFVRKALSLFGRERAASIITYTAMLPQLAYTMLMPVGLSRLFDGGILHHNAHVVTTTLGWLAGGYLVSAIGGLAQDYFSAVAATRGMIGLRERMFSHAQKLADGVLQEIESSRVTAIFGSDLTLIETVVTRVLPNLIFRSLLLVGSVCVAFSMEWHMALASIICLPVAFLAPRPLARLAIKANYERKAQDATLASLVQENLTLSRTVHVFNLQQYRLTAFRNLLDDLDRKAIKANVDAALAGRFTSIGASFVQLLVIGIGAVLSLQGELSAGIVVAFIGLLLNIGGAIAGIADSIPLLIQVVSAWQRVDMLLDEPVAPDEAAHLEPGRWNGVSESITFDDVVFNFPMQDPLLDRLSFTVRMGEAVAIVGPSGSGKSTILNLLQRHLLPTGGKLLLDGTSIETIAAEDLHGRMATVAQDCALFNISIRENIRMGRLDATDEDVVAAAVAAEIDPIIQQLPEGYDTLVGEAGGHLSGGQRQRIAIARALIRNPSVLILDEATSALDADSEHAINETFERLRSNRIILSVTHRLQSAVTMDRIILLRAGLILETGTHDELLERDGVYAELWWKQSGLAATPTGRGARITPERLTAIPFFKALPPDKAEEIARMMQSETAAARDVLIQGGSMPVQFHIIVRGQVAVMATDASGNPVLVHELHAGDYFGEFALLESMHQMNTVVAATDCSLLSLQREQFRRALQNEPDLLEAIEQAIAAGLQPQLDGLVAEHVGGSEEKQPAPESEPA